MTWMYVGAAVWVVLAVAAVIYMVVGVRRAWPRGDRERR